MEEQMATFGMSHNFPFQPKYIRVKGSRIHYIESGQGDPILFLHGNPTSSYLWRNIIPHCSEYGRCIAPDLIGFGKSEKPDIGYRVHEHYQYVEEFIERMKLNNITLVVHDWGSALGYHYARLHEKNIKGIAFMEAILKTFSWSEFPSGFRVGFRLFRSPVLGWIMIGWLNMFVKQILPKATVRKLTEKEMDVYREPFKRIRSRKPIWVFPNEIPINGEPGDVADMVNQYNDWLKVTDLPKLLFFASPGGIINQRTVQWCIENLKNLSTVDIGEGIHYVQEDSPHTIGAELANWIKNLSA